MHRQFKAGLFFAFGGFVVAYIVATAWADYWLYTPVDYDFLLRNAFQLPDIDNELFTHVWIIFLLLCMAGFVFGAHVASEGLTKQGASSWQSKLEMRRNNLLGKPGAGFILAKTTSPKRKGQYITSDDFPNCLIVAPTGAGKGVGFVYPNLLTFEGSTVTLDIKGENYDTTARWRASMGNKVFKFAPVQFDAASHRYNPLERIGKLQTYGQVSFELRKIATLFLQAEGAGEWLNGAIQLFCVMGGVALERNDFTLGGIYRAISEGDQNLQKHLSKLSKTAKEPALQRELRSLAMLEQKTLSSYMSVMNNAGFDLWSNPHVDDMTSSSDFNFDNIRREKTSIYFIVSDGDLKPLAGLVRLFFNELVSTIQAKKPGKDEPYHAMLILDEFHRLGKMSEVADAMTTIRGFNGRIAIITQTIPKLDKIYSKEERLSIQGGAGLKLYMTPSEEMTIEDLSTACGVTTKRTITKSRQTGISKSTTISERTDERPLLPPDEARRLDPNVAIIIVNGKQPVKVKSIRHYEDRRFADILTKQERMSWDTVNKSLENSRLASVERRLDRQEKREQVAAAQQRRDPEIQLTKDDLPTIEALRALRTEDMIEMREIVDTALALSDEVAKMRDAPQEQSENNAGKPQRTIQKEAGDRQQLTLAVDVDQPSSPEDSLPEPDPVDPTPKREKPKSRPPQVDLQENFLNALAD